MRRLDRKPHGGRKDRPTRGRIAGRRISVLFWLVACGLTLCSAFSRKLHGFTFISSPPTVWIDDAIPMELRLGPPLATPLRDGSTSYNAVAANVIALWNQHLATVKFTASSESQRAPEDGDGINQVFFDSTIYGEAFPEEVLAVTTRWSIRTTRVESDIIFNSAKQWDSYRGGLRFTADGTDVIYDFQRAALHEFGHSLGLGHPDQVGQGVVAIMNSTISNLDRLATDDTLGAAALYGGAPIIVTDPRSQTVTAGAKAEFDVVARGLARLDYQWLFEGQPIEGATNTTYSIERVQSTHSGKYAVLVSNSKGSIESKPATLGVDQGTAFGVVGVPFNYQITSDNNANWFMAAGLPPGLNCQGRTGLISGIPTKRGTFLVDVTARYLSSSVSATISFTIDEGVITSPTLVGGVIGVPFGYRISSDNEATWHTASGLPPGLICDGRTGLISGTPNRLGTFPVEVMARNRLGSTSTNIVFFIDDGEITSPDSAEGIVKVPFRYQISANNLPTWYTASGLPSGLICRGSTGVISGTPNETGTFSVEVTARNQFASTATRVSLRIVDGTILTGASPKIEVLQNSEGFLLAWPVTSEGFVLEEAQGQPHSWTNSGMKVVVQGSQKMVVIPGKARAKFYRLRKIETLPGVGLETK